jgi:acyl carrier protein
MIDFLRAQVLQDPSEEIAANTPLISSGLVDSFAVIEVLLRLEAVTSRRIPAAEVTPNDLDSVEQMLFTAERIGKPR